MDFFAVRDWSPAEIQETLDSTTRKWWFFLAFLLLQLLPPYASKGYGLFEWPTVNMHIVTHALKLRCAALYPVFKVIPILLVVSVLLFRNKVVKLFGVYTGVSYVLFAFLNSISVTEEYGLGICTANLAMFLFIAALWFWEVVVGKNDFTARKEPVWKYWVVPVALVAFWQPVDSATLMPDFNPLYFLTSGAGLAFCLMTPVYLALLTIYHPRVNLAVLRVTSLAGVIIGLGNMGLPILIPTYWWVGVLHIPLLTISGYGLVLSFKGG